MLVGAATFTSLGIYSVPPAERRVSVQTVARDVGAVLSLIFRQYLTTNGLALVGMFIAGDAVLALPGD